MTKHGHNGDATRAREFDVAKHEVERRDTLAIWFSRIATDTAKWVGSPIAFLMAGVSVIIWGVLGPIYHYSDTWQLVINTGTTVVTFLMVFLIQNTQNRDAKAVHLKLDELIRAIHGARNHLVDLEKLSDEELKKLEEQFTQLRERAEKAANRADQAATRSVEAANVRS